MVAMFKPIQPAKRVLVVDNDTAVAADICDFLNANDHFQAEHVGDGDSAFEACRREHFDLVIVEYLVPGMDALQLLSVLKRLNSHSVPAILLSGNSLGELALRSGAAAFLEKPFPTDRLLDEVAKIPGMTAGAGDPGMASSFSVIEDPQQKLLG